MEPALIERFVAGYEAGAETTELTAYYQLGAGTVLKLLRQGLSPGEVDIAMRFYAEAGHWPESDVDSPGRKRSYGSTLGSGPATDAV